MSLFFRSITLLWLFQVSLFACAVCKLQVPSVHINVLEQHTDKQMQLDVTWRFSKYFSAETLLSYDDNGDSTLDKEELSNIHKSFIEYLEKDHYVTFLKYMPEEQAYDKAPHIDFDVSEQKTDFKEDQIIFTYRMTADVTPQVGHVCYLSFYDKEGYFKFNIKEIKQEISQEGNTTAIVNNSASFLLTKTKGDSMASRTEQLEQMDDEPQKLKQGGFLGYLSTKMEETKESILTLLEEIEMKGSILSYLWLLLFSFIYGMIHAIGPGHGKSLVSAYFLSNNRSTVKAFSIASLIAVVHTFSAFTLTFVIYYILNAYLNEYFTDVESITTKISALVIIAIALYLLYKKIPKKSKVKPLWSKENPNEHQTSCGCGACKSTSTDLGVILSAGIIPCPGTITIFVFAISYGMYTVGFLSAVFMSIGMSFVIFAAALLSIMVRQRASSHTKLRTILDYGSLAFILMLGVFLFFVA
ncbi:MAG: DUF1007 family protein [Sulfurovum sp.]|nr:MAG: DUF1007 family protein [Sulfurovum sp.]